MELIIGAVGSLVSLLGWFVFRSSICVFAGTAICIILTAIQWNGLTERAKKMDIVVFLLGVVVGLIFTNTPAWYICGMLGIAIYNIAISILSLAMLLMM